MTYGTVIVGGSLAGGTAADSLIAAGYDRSIAIVDSEIAQMYARPPLSKSYLKGLDSEQSIAIPASEHSVITRFLGETATKLDLDNSRVVTSSLVLDYENLIIATGATPRRFQTGPHELVLRTLSDAREIRQRLNTAETVLVVGGGVLAVEIASAALAMGREVSLVASSIPLQKALGPFLSDIALSAADARGARIEVWPEGIELVHDTSGEVTGVRSVDGRQLGAELVVTAIGDEPNTDWLASSGVDLSPDGWIWVNEFCQVSTSGEPREQVFAIGDVTCSPALGPRSRLPHWENAIGQARAAAETIVSGAATLHTPEPYFWTEAFGMDLKMAGGPFPMSGIPRVSSGSLEDRSALLTWEEPGGLVTAAAALNLRLPVRKIKNLVGSRYSP